MFPALGRNIAYCQKDVDGCKYSLCGLQGTCVISEGNFSLLCDILWSEGLCKRYIKSCSYGPCKQTH